MRYNRRSDADKNLERTLLVDFRIICQSQLVYLKGYRLLGAEYALSLSLSYLALRPYGITLLSFPSRESVINDVSAEDAGVLRFR